MDERVSDAPVTIAVFDSFAIASEQVQVEGGVLCQSLKLLVDAFATLEIEVLKVREDLKPDFVGECDVESD